MDEHTRKTLADNIKKLMAYHELSQDAVAQKSGISQKTVSNILNYSSSKRGPTIDNIAAIASMFKLEVWHLLIPNQPTEVLLSKSIEKLVDNYSNIDNAGRENLTRISENEMRYCDKQNIKKTGT